MKAPATIILSRTDGIGDMVLMLPMAGILKTYFPNTIIAVLGKAYTKPLVACCKYVDEFIDEKDFFTKQIQINNTLPDCIIHVRTDKEVAKRAKKLGIKNRIGTASRLYHWFTCNTLIPLKRKKSTLHEAQLNIKLLNPLGITKTFTTNELMEYYGLDNIEPLQANFGLLIVPNKFTVIIHAKSEGSSREWPVENVIGLINCLDAEQFTVILTGVEKEKAFIDNIIIGLKRPVVNLCGGIGLGQFIALIKQVDVLVANATGPVHMSAALQTNTVALYQPMKPIHPGRWAPLGKKVKVFVGRQECKGCKKTVAICACMQAIQPIAVQQYLQELLIKKIR